MTCVVWLRRPNAKEESVADKCPMKMSGKVMSPMLSMKGGKGKSSWKIGGKK